MSEEIIDEVIVNEEAAAGVVAEEVVEVIAE